MNKKNQSRKKTQFPVLLRITNRIVLFFFLSTLAFFLLYISGNIQQFMDSSLLTILNLCFLTSAMLFITSFFAILQYIAFSLTNNTRIYARYFFIYLVFTFFGILGIILSRGIELISSGMII